MKKTVVIVEDEIPIALAERLILQDEYIVHLAHDGDQALTTINKVKPDVVILDWMMPKKNGLEVCQAIRANAALKHTKVVMVTAKNTPRDEFIGITNGADDYIAKPFEPIELLHVTKQVLR